MSRLIVYFLLLKGDPLSALGFGWCFCGNCVDSGGRGEGGARTRRGALIGSLLRMSPFRFLDCFDIRGGNPYFNTSAADWETRDFLEDMRSLNI